MSDYQRKIEARERRINVMRVTRALYEAIGGEWCSERTADISPAVQRLASMLHYMPEQLVKDIKDLYHYTTDKVYEDKEREHEFD